MTYNNFNEQLAKEQNPEVQEHLTAFYLMYFSNYEVVSIDYNNPYGMFLQHAGVDKVLLKKYPNGNFKEQKLIQEKIVFSSYPNFLFEYERKSGAEGWAISLDEKPDYLLYYMNGDIYIFYFEALRKWLRDNKELFIRKYRKDTDNKNFMIPIDYVMRTLNKENLNVIKFNKDLERL